MIAPVNQHNLTLFYMRSEIASFWNTSINDWWFKDEHKNHNKNGRHCRRPLTNLAILSSNSPIRSTFENVTGVDNNNYSCSHIVHSLISMNLLSSLCFFNENSFSLYCYHTGALNFLDLMWNVSVFCASYLHYYKAVWSHERWRWWLYNFVFVFKIKEKKPYHFDLIKKPEQILWFFECV